jgi:hypothetical protein
VRGPFDPERDSEALRTERVRREVALTLGVKLERREDPGPIAYSDAATQRTLEAMLEARRGPKAMEDLEGAFKRTTGRDPERVNRVMALLGRPSPDREFYQTVFRRLVDSYPLPENELQLLATRRAEVIVEYLTRSAGIEPSRVEVSEVRAVNAPSDQGVTTHLALDVAKDAPRLSRASSVTNRSREVVELGPGRLR